MRTRFFEKLSAQTAWFFCAASLVFASTTGFAGTTPPPARLQAAEAERDLQAYARSLVRVNSTSQSYDFLRPWLKKNPSTRRGLGVVVAENRVLVTAELVANHTYIELERPASGERIAARLEFVDYEANLALLSATDPEFLKQAEVLQLDETAAVESTVEILQLEPNGQVAATQAKITTITMAPYLLDDAGMLVFRLTAPIQQRDGSFVLPAVRDGRLLGILMRYDARNQTADVIPPPVIQSFLESAASGSLAAFPRAGIVFAPLRDPQLRKYLGLEAEGGVLVTEVEPRGSGESAGLKKEDVILSIDGIAIDSDGNFSHPRFGRLPLSYLIAIQKKSGDVVDLEVFREGEIERLSMPLRRVPPTERSVPPYLFDTAPEYFIRGGLVFQELSRPYLQEWGGEWRGNAPQRLVVAELMQNELRPGGEKVVVLTDVIPTAATIGYEGISQVIVEEVDGKPVHSLRDLAEALDAGRDGHIHELRLEDEPRVLFLDSATAKKADEQVRRQYGIPELSRFQPSAVHDTPQPGN